MSWKEENNCLIREFLMKDFDEARWLVELTADLAEVMDHHPRIIWEYNRVIISLTTHDSGHTVTDKDREFAQRLDAALED